MTAPHRGLVFAHPSSVWKWLGWAGFDTIGRLALLTASTVVFSRVLLPHEFGITALVFIAVTVAAVSVGAPFEEALAQRRGLERKHVETALATAMMAATALLLLSIPLAILLARVYREPQMAFLLPVTMVSIFFTGYSDILTGLARRRRRFNDIARASLFGNAIGISVSIVMALFGFGVWALVAQRLLVAVAVAGILSWRTALRLRPRFSLQHLREMRWFAAVSLADRVAENVNYLAFNYLVGTFYGLTVLGYVNMAMRLIEPLRGAMIGPGHNIAFLYFSSVQSERPELGARVELVVSRAVLVIAPVFVGLAAVMPVLLPLIAGPGWERSVDIAACLSLGCAILLPVRFVYTALAASARPQFNLISNVAGMSMTIIALLLAVGLGPVAVGIARLAGDVVQACIAICLSTSILEWRRTSRLYALLPVWSLSCLMGAAVLAFVMFTPGLARPLALVLSIALGAAIYTLTLAIFAKSRLRDLAGLMTTHPH